MLFENLAPIFQIVNASPLVNSILVCLEVAMICVTALLGIFGVAAALNGFLFRGMNIIFRIIMAAGGLCMMIPGFITDIIGLALMGAVCFLQYRWAKRKA